MATADEVSKRVNLQGKRFYGFYSKLKKKTSKINPTASIRVTLDLLLQNVFENS